MPYRVVTKVYLPSRKTIANRCRKIRERGGWKNQDGKLRSAWPAHPFRAAGDQTGALEVETPEVSARELGIDVAELDAEGSY